MPVIDNHQWDPDILSKNPLYEPLLPWQPFIEHYRDAWPTLADLQSLIAQQAPPIYSHGGASIRLVEQGGAPETFDEYYESRIYLKGEIQTRSANWHDFFQVLVWRSFPKSKVALNKRHYQQSLQRHNRTPPDRNRGPIENALALFDECGAVVVSSRPHLFDLVSEHDWQELFLQQRQTFDSLFKCFIFGHAIYEKGVAPYIGMTAKAVFVSVNDEFFNRPLLDQLAHLDELVAGKIEQIQSPKELQPFPLLGVPGWHPENKSPEFYDNRDYFRARKLP